VVEGDGPGLSEAEGMGDQLGSLLDATVKALEGMHLSPEMVVVIVSALPIFEIRGGVLVGLLLFHLPAGKVLVLGVLGNVLTVTPLLFLIDPVSKWLYGNRLADRLLHWLFSRAKRHAAQVNRWGPLGLVVFTSIPVPGNGAMTAAVVAILVGMRKRRAMCALYAGIVVSGVVIAMLVAGVRALL
jgi:uncharacterized membrane protein